MLLSACGSSRSLVEAPNLFAYAKPYPSESVAPVHRTSSAGLLFVTDRQQASSGQDALSYGNKRSSSMAFGRLIIEFGEGLTWEGLVKASSSADREKAISLKPADPEEIVRFPDTPLPFSFKGGVIKILPDAEAAYQKAIVTLQATLRRRLTAIKNKEVIVFVHGFNTDFNEAALSMAELWHFTGRLGLPLFYSWPAASGGPFGYFTDRESGEFSIYHLKETLRILAAVPELERIHIIAHSRGTDITTSALRELVIEVRAAGHDPRTVLKIENLILAAPDLDFDVVRQRLMAEKFGPAIGQITVYMNPSDEALGISQLLMSGLRFGKLAHNNLEPIDRKIFSRMRNVNFIDVEGISSFIGHGYYRKHPGVLSDIAIVIRERLRPGEKGRPLIHDQINFWTLPVMYPIQ
ncbi:alpha/beta hydrolase [Methylomarinum sp. Ch1-1]|uniref:Alpha/beta hydrolase n=1 Tax=Methylomarinum roseum TaxID=3067653 RepID=A0AAU7NQV2_9GAMM